MTQGITGTFGINGTDLTLPPTDHRWVERDVIGDSGAGRPIYPAVRQYELRWDLMPMSDFAQIQQAYQIVQSSGTLVVDLPKFATAPYQFYSYSGCTMREPTQGKFYEKHVTDVVLIVQRIRTS